MDEMTRERFWRGRRVLVTGATGMIGSWLVKDLVDRGATVVALVLDPDPRSELYRSGTIDRVHVVAGALEDFATVERALGHHEVEVVFHLGAQTIVGTAHRYPLATFEANIRGTYNLLEACRIHADRLVGVVVASSDKAYGDGTPVPYEEAMPVVGRHPYEVSKSCADLIAQAYHHTYELPVSIARCGNVFGGGDLNWNRIVPGTIQALLHERAPVIRSDGTPVRDYIYVRDIADAYLTLAEGMDNGTRGEAFNFSAEAPLSVLDVVRRVQDVVGVTIEPVVLGNARGEIHRQYLSAEKARARLGWKPRFELEVGMRETVEWYRGFFDDRR